MNTFAQEIAKQIAPLAGIEVEQVASCIEIPKNRDNGDFSFPVAKINRFKKLPGNPAAIAAQWVPQIKATELITGATAAGPYLNFTVNTQLLVDHILKEVIPQVETWGSTTEGKGKHIIVEYSSPNIAKPFHCGHLRSTIIGNFMKNIFKFQGYSVTGINYLGDWGKQYGLLAVGFEKYGNEERLQKSPILHLFEVYVAVNKDVKTEAELSPPQTTTDDKARAYFKRMEDGDKDALALWTRFRGLSIVEYTRMYKRLNVEFDEYSGESQMSDGMDAAFQKLEESKLIEDDKGAKLVNLEKFKLGKVLVKKSDGTSLYLTRDIAAAAMRKEKYKFDKMYYVVASPQDLHFQQLFKILGNMGQDWVKTCTHINFGMVRGMKTRTGEVVFLEQILEEAKAAMLAQMKVNPEKFAEIEDPDHVANLIGVTAVVVQDFSARRVKDYDFDWDRMVSFEGDTGPYLQYQHARLCSMERKSGIKVNPTADFKLLSEPEAAAIAVHIARFPEAIATAATQIEPCVLLTYLFELAHAISAAHSVLWVKGREQAVAEARMTLFWVARHVLGNGLKVLGLIPLERM